MFVPEEFTRETLGCTRDALTGLILHALKLTAFSLLAEVHASVSVKDESDDVKEGRMSKGECPVNPTVIGLFAASKDGGPSSGPTAPE